MTGRNSKPKHQKINLKKPGSSKEDSGNQEAHGKPNSNHSKGKNTMNKTPLNQRNPSYKGKVNKEKEKPSLVDMVLDHLGPPHLLVHDKDRDIVLKLPEEGNNVAESITSKNTIDRICLALYEEGTEASEEAVINALKAIKGRYRIAGNKVKSYVTVGDGNKPNQVILDLRHQDKALAVLKGGEVNIIREGEETVMLRLPGMLPFPMPADEPDPGLAGLNHLLDMINAPEPEKYLTLAWMAYVLTHPINSKVPQIFLVILGGQGSGKSSFCKWILRHFVDPSSCSVMELSNNLEDMSIASQSVYMPIYDNVRHLTKSCSDRLCKVSTGGTANKRKLYTNGEAYTTSLQSPIVINGIVNPVTEPDLNDRCLYLNLDPISPEDRMTEQEMEDYLVAHEGQIFRALLELGSQALHTVGSVTSTHPQRMIDFSNWLAACEQVMDIDPGYLEKAYADNQVQAYQAAIGEHPLANALYNFALLYCVDSPWQGTCSELLPLLEELVSDRDIRAHFHEWPHSPESLGRRFMQYVASLDALGVRLERPVRGRSRTLKISLKDDSPYLTELAEA